MSTPLSISIPDNNHDHPGRTPSALHTTSPAYFHGTLPPNSQAGPSTSSPYLGSQPRLPNNPFPSSPGNPVRPFGSQQPIAGPSRLPQSQPYPPHSFGPPSIPGPDSSSQHANGNLSDSQKLQARLALAQQAIMQPRQQNGAQLPGTGPGGQGLQAGGTQRKLSTGSPEWAAMANAMGGPGMMNSMQGASKEAILKQVRALPAFGDLADCHILQLQALQSSHAQRARGNQPQTPQTGANGTPGSISIPSPASGSVPSPAATATSLPLQSSTPHSANAMAGPSTPSSQNGFPHSLHQSTPSQSSPNRPQTPARPLVGVNGVPVANGPGSAPGSTGLQLTQQQKGFLLGQQERMRLASHQEQQQSQPSSLPPPPLQQPPSAAQDARPPAQPPGAKPQPAHQRAEQRRQFMNTFNAFHKQYNLPSPREIYNGERDGALKVGDKWLELLDLFMFVMRNQGITNVSELILHWLTGSGDEAVGGQPNVAKLPQLHPPTQSPPRACHFATAV